MKTFLRLIAQLLGFRWLVLLAILLGIATVASNMVLLSMAAYLIAYAALKPLLIVLTVPIYLVRAMSVVRAVSRYAERLVSHSVTFRLLARLRSEVYSRLEPLVPAGLRTYRSGDLVARLVTDVDELQHVYLRVVAPFVVAGVIALLAFGLFGIFSLALAVFMVVALAVAGVGIPLLAARFARGIGREQIEARAELNAQLVDGIQGVQDLLACGHAETQRRKVRAVDTLLAGAQRRMARISGLEQALSEAMSGIAILGVLLLAIPLVSSHRIDGVYLGFLALLALASFEAVQPLGQALQFLGRSVAAGERLHAIIDTPPPVTDPAVPHALPAMSRAPELTFEHVTFAYDEAEGSALEDISFMVRPGSCVALVGPSGAGKSTIARLALRFWDPQAGTIRLNGQDTHEVAQDDLRRAIGMVAQDTYIFNDTIKRNLLLAKPNATDDEIERALEQAQLAEFVRGLPDGLKTWVGEQGLRLSGGERQRLAIARALLKDAPLLILDEATANLDTLTERALVEALETLMQRRTTLVITHRLVAMERMDEILVLDGGRIVERGTHGELLAHAGLYRRLYEIQNTMLAIA
jgi:ATP-binding cassette subfamily C protein CydC